MLCRSQRQGRRTPGSKKTGETVHFPTWDTPADSHSYRRRPQGFMEKEETYYHWIIPYGPWTTHSHRSLHWPLATGLARWPLGWTRQQMSSRKQALWGSGRGQLLTPLVRHQIWACLRCETMYQRIVCSSEFWAAVGMGRRKSGIVGRAAPQTTWDLDAST